MATFNFEKFNSNYGSDNDLAKTQTIDILRDRLDTSIDWSIYEGRDNLAIFHDLEQRDKEGQKIQIEANNPAKPIDIVPLETTYKNLRNYDQEAKKREGIANLPSRTLETLVDKLLYTPPYLEKRKEGMETILHQLKRAGVTPERFSKEYGDSPALAQHFTDREDLTESIFSAGHKIKAALTGESYNEKVYNKELQAYKLSQELGEKRHKGDRSYTQITKEQRKIIEDNIGAFSTWWRNDSDKELVDYFLDLQNAQESIKKFMPAYTRLQNVNIHEQFFGLTGKEKDLNKRQKQVVDDYGIIAETLGFDGIAYNKTGMYFIKDEKAYKVEQHFWDELKEIAKANANAIILGVAGAVHGAKKGAEIGARGGAVGSFGGMVIGGAAGSVAGGAMDSVLTDILLNKKIDIPQALLHGAQEGVFNIVADGVFKAVGTGFRYFANASRVKDIAGTITDYTPLVGFVKRAHTGNKNSAEQTIANAVDKETQEALKQLEEFFGAEVNIGQLNTTAAQSALRKIEQKLGSESFITRGAKKFYDTFALADQKSAQKDFIRAIRADESGNLTAFLAEAANSSPKMQKTLQEILATTSARLKDQLQGVGLAPNTIKRVFDNLERGTKQSYNDAIENVLGSVYDDSYKTILKRNEPNYPEHLELGEGARFNSQSYDNFRKTLENSGVLPEDSMKFLNFVESTIYNPKGVSFNQLNNALKTINSYYKQAADPNFKSFVKNAVEGFIKRDIKAGIEQIFRQNNALYDDARELFETALSDYARMKDALKLVDKLKLRDRASTYEQITQRLSKFFLAQGDDIPNFQALLAPLQKEAREEFELKLLQDMLELSMVRLSDDMAVADTTEFFKRLDPIKSQFASKSAHDFIEIAQHFHTLFRNDATLARMLSPTTTEKIGSSIATSLEGAIRFQAIKMLFANIIRLLPHIPFAKRLNESVQGSALRFHLKKALDSSISVGEFKLTLKARSAKADFTNATREKINQILAQTNAEQLAAKELEAEVTKLKGGGEGGDTGGTTPHSGSTPQSTPESNPASASGASETSIFEQAQAEKRAKETQQLEKERANAQALAEAAEAIKQRDEALQAAKDAQAGKSEAQRTLYHGEPIAMRETNLPHSSISVSDEEITPLKFVVVKASDVRPNFSQSELQPRAAKDARVIEQIASNFSPALIFGRGGYKDLPIIKADGQVVLGNHRVQGFKDFTPQSREAYQKEVKDRYGVELQDDELLLRTPAEPLSDEKLIQLAFHSNKDDVKTLSDKTLAALGRYAPKMKDLPIIITSESLQELKAKVARTLAPEQALPDEREAGLALLAHLSKSTRQTNIAEVLNSLHHLNPQAREKVLSMFIDNAGSFYNLSHRTASLGMHKLDLRPYLLETIATTAEATFKERWENFAKLNENIRNILDTTDAQGRNAMIDTVPRVYENTMSEILGAALARFTRLENPSDNLYQALKDAPQEMQELHAPAFDFESGGITQGKALADMDIIDLADYLIRTGESSQEVRESLELLPKFREKWEAYKTARKESAETGEKGAGEASEELPQEIKDIIDTSPQSGRDMKLIGAENFNASVVEYAQKQNKKVAIEKLDPREARELGFKHPDDVRVTIDASAINHTLNRHGTESNLAQKSGQKAVDHEQISRWREYVKGADEKILGIDDLNQPVIVSFKQINGNAVVVESIRKKGNELAFKSMYFEKGSYKDTKAYKDAMTSQKLYNSIEASHSPAPRGYEPRADDSTPPIKADSADSSAKVFNMQDTTLDTLENFSRFSNLAGVALDDLPLSKIKSLHKEIMDNLEKIQC